MPMTETKEVQEEKANLIGMDGPMVPISVTSFEDLDAMLQADAMANAMKDKTKAFAEMAENIFLNEEIEDKAAALQKLANEFSKRVSDVADNPPEVKETKEEDCEDCEEEPSAWQKTLDGFTNLLADHSKQERTCKTQGGTCYPASDWAHVPDRTKPSTWKLLMAQGRPGNITISQLGRAAAAFSPGGFRGNRVQLSSQEAARAKAKIRSKYRSLGVKPADIPDGVKEVGSFHVWKEADQYRWLAVYSNNIRDNDNPPEIISSDSHQRFVEMVDKGQADLPELWLWHVPQWRWGEATSVAYDDNGFAVAIGTVDQNEAAESVAEWTKEQENILTSHGMPKRTIKRDKEDSTIITEHITREVSPLFDWAAANKFTQFTVLKEQDIMAEKGIPEEKRQELQENGLSAEVLAALEEQNEATAKETDSLEKKEGTEETTSNDEVIKAFKILAKEVLKLSNEVKELKKSDIQKVKEQVENLPPASLDAWMEGLFKEGNAIPANIEVPGAKVTEPETPDGPFFQVLGWTQGTQEAQ